MTPRLSVVIPAHNAEPFLAEAVASIYAQSLALPIEVVVYNDGSSDGTEAVLRSLGDKVVKLGGVEACGAAFARNRAMEACRGELLAFLDADDLWEPDKLALQLPLLEASSAPCAVFGKVREFNAQGPLGEAKKAALPLACLLRRETALRAGPFDESLKIGDFADWLARLQELPTEFLYVDSLVARRRLHETNLGRRSAEHRKDYLEVVRRRLARQRASQSGTTQRTEER